MTAAVCVCAAVCLCCRSEFSVSLVVLLATAGFGLVDDNRSALDTILLVSALIAAPGIALLTMCHEYGLPVIGSGLAWIIGVGACTFLAYVPLGTMLFDRLLGAAKEEMTSSLLNLIMDASVLLGTATLLCYKDFLQPLPAASSTAPLLVANGSDTTSSDSANVAAAALDEDAAHMHRFFCGACKEGGLAVSVLLLLATWSLGSAVDRRRRVVEKLDAAEAL